MTSDELTITTVELMRKIDLAVNHAVRAERERCVAIVQSKLIKALDGRPYPMAECNPVLGDIINEIEERDDN